MHKLEQIPGNAKAKKNLQTLLKKGKIANPLLFSGPAGVLKTEFALAFAEELLAAENPVMRALNLRLFAPEGKGVLYSASLIEESIDFIKTAPFETSHKVAIFTQTERMTPISANALLKTLEEPPEHSIILLISSFTAKLLPTIISRCFQLSFLPLSEEEIVSFLKKEYAKSHEEARRIALLSHGQLERAKILATEEGNSFFSLIAAIGNAATCANYLELQKLLPKLEAFITAAEGTDRLQRMEESLLALFYWYRDLELLRRKGEPSLLFFSHWKKTLEGCLDFFSLTLEQVSTSIRKVQSALERNIKFSHAIEPLLYAFEAKK